MSSFVQFILMHTQEDSAWGDFAMDIMDDPEVRCNWGTEQVFRHLQKKTAWEVVFRVYEEMAEAYKNHVMVVTPVKSESTKKVVFKIKPKKALIKD